MQRFCRYANAEVRDAGGEETEAERTAADMLYMHMAGELLVQNTRLSVDGGGGTMNVYFERSQSERGVQTVSRHRGEVKKVVFCFCAREEVEAALQRAVWQWMRLAFPGTRCVALRPLGDRDCLHVLEVETALTFKDVDMVEIHYESGRCLIGNINFSKLSSARDLGCLVWK